MDQPGALDVTRQARDCTRPLILGDLETTYEAYMHWTAGLMRDNVAKSDAGIWLDLCLEALSKINKLKTDWDVMVCALGEQEKHTEGPNSLYSNEKTLRAYESRDLDHKLNYQVMRLRDLMSAQISAATVDPSLLTKASTSKLIQNILKDACDKFVKIHNDICQQVRDSSNPAKLEAKTFEAEKSKRRRFGRKWILNLFRGSKKSV